uniref:DUF1768 domain-containing protein n=1 Tax=Caenorhabditis tropicalis TaxID=1561998 RepID=A0A1I7UD14_9PELO
MESKQGLLDTKSLASALPTKTPEQRPKYAKILQQEKKASPDAATAAGNVKESPGAKNVKKEKKPDGKRPFKIYVKRQEVVALPDDVATREFSISPDNVIYFSGPGHWLSALYPVKIVVDGNEYNSVEHYYQACKLYILVGEKSAAALKASGTPLEVKKATKEILNQEKIKAKEINDWKDKDSVGVLKHVLLQKFQQHEDLKAKLLETGDKLLVQTYIGDTYFAAGAGTKYTSIWVTRHTNQVVKLPENVVAESVKYLPLIANGKNVLGWILMQVRDELRQSSA